MNRVFIQRASLRKTGSSKPCLISSLHYTSCVNTAHPPLTGSLTSVSSSVLLVPWCCCSMLLYREIVSSLKSLLVQLYCGYLNRVTEILPSEYSTPLYFTPDELQYLKASPTLSEYLCFELGPALHLEAYAHALSFCAPYQVKC